MSTKTLTLGRVQFTAYPYGGGYRVETPSGRTWYVWPDWTQRTDGVRRFRLIGEALRRALFGVTP